MGLRRWLRGRPSNDEMREELEAHVAMRAEHDRVDAAAARRRLGNTLRTREAMRRVWVAEWWDALRQDARFTWRSWRRQPGFALAAILVLALGLGASTALFAALDRVLFRPLPYADPDRLVSAGVLVAPPEASLAGQALLGRTETISDSSYVRVWDTTPAPFESVTSLDTWTCTIIEDPPEGIRCGAVEQNFLQVLGVRVALGRDFAPEDDVRGAPLVAIISHDLWVRRYGADPGVLGRTLNLERSFAAARQIPIVGVLPADFEMPVESADVLLPSQLRPLDPDQPFETLIMAFARLKPGVTPELAEAMLAPQLPAIRESLPPSWRVAWRVRPVRDRRFGDAARVAALLMGAVAAFLLIACVNVTNLMVTRAAERRREFAIRAAIGASAGRLSRLALAETLLLSIAAGGVALLIAFALLRTFMAMAPAGLPGIAEASIDGRVFAVAGLLVVGTGTAIGLWPAISVFRSGGLQGLRARSPSSTGTRPRARFALVTTQIALTLALLGGSALLLRSLRNIVNVPLGFDGDHVITLTAALSPTRYPTPERAAAFFEELLARARATPGAVSAALSDAAAPPLPAGRIARLDVEGQPADPDAPRPAVGFRTVTPQYFETFRIPVVRGRTFRESDRTGEPVVVLNESADRMLFPGERSLGRRVRLPDGPLSQWYTVVGVTADVRNGQSITDDPGPEIYLSARRGASAVPVGRLSLRTTASAADGEAFLRQIAAELDPQQLVFIATVDQVLANLTARPRFTAWLLTAFAALALLLAAAGLYSVASYLVTQRRHDIGVRMALGAAPGDVARHVVGEAGRWMVGGALLGCALGWLGTRALRSQLYGVDALDPWAWAAALLALALVLLAAVFRPARRAAHVDPVAVLRAE